MCITGTVYNFLDKPDSAAYCNIHCFVTICLKFAAAVPNNKIWNYFFFANPPVNLYIGLYNYFFFANPPVNLYIGLYLHSESDLCSRSNTVNTIMDH